VIFGPIEKEYIKTGKIGGFAVSEARAETIHEAVKHTWVLAVEVETTHRESSALQNTMIDINGNTFSAISTDILEIGAVAGLGPVWNSTLRLLAYWQRHIDRSIQKIGRPSTRLAVTLFKLPAILKI
jgi:hypothetical protein